MFRAKLQKENSVIMYMFKCMCMCRCAFFTVLSPCTAASG